MKPVDSFIPIGLFRLAGAVLGAGLLVLPAGAAASDRGTPGDEAAPAVRAVTVEAGYSSEVLAVLRGGLQRGATFRGLTEAAVNFDLAALAGAPSDTQLRVSGLQPHGGSLSRARLGDWQGASNIEAYNHPLLYELWLGGKLANQHVAWRAGRVVADAEFATTDSGGVFLNSSFGWPAFISGNTLNTGPAYPRNALGLSTRIELTDTLSAQAGVYDGDTFDDPAGDPSRHPDGLHFELSRRQGLFALWEIARTWSMAPAAGGRPGGFKLGLWRHTAAFADFRDPTRFHAGNRGFYAVAEQMLWRGPDAGGRPPRGVTAFVRAGASPGDRNIFSHTWDAGLAGSGLIAGRGADVLGLGVAMARIGAAARTAEIARGAGVILDHEMVVELSYRLYLHEHWQITPDAQWIRHPGGSATLPDAFVVGLRTRLTY